MRCKLCGVIQKCAAVLALSTILILAASVFSPTQKAALHQLSVFRFKKTYEVKSLYRAPPVRKERRNRFVYIKIEKTGSSTMSNIFSAYGYRYRLNMMMSTIKQSLINTRELEPGNSWNIGPDASNPHISEQHARYNPELFSRYFPEDTVYITCIRHPVKWFISYVDFMSAYRIFTQENLVDFNVAYHHEIQWSQVGHYYRRHNPRSVLHNMGLFEKTRDEIVGLQKHVHNNFLQFLGFDVYKSWDEKAIRDYIDFVDHRFFLVMITDYFDESLVLLKRMMNWTLVDIFYSYANEARHRSNTVFTEREKDKLLDKDHNYGDWLLYQHFNQSFWGRVNSQPDFFDELHQFKSLKTQVQQFCYSEELKHNKSLTLQFSTIWDGQMTVRDEDCLASKIVNGKAPELSHVLDEYIPFRGSKTKSDIRKH